MNPFYESFQKELGKRSAQAIAATLTVIFSVAASRIDMHTARVLLLCLAGLSLLALVCGLWFHCLSNRLSGDTRKVLMFIFHIDRDVSVQDVAQHFDFMMNVADFHIADLMKKGFVVWSNIGHQSPLGSSPTTYSLTTKGQKYAIDHDS